MTDTVTPTTGWAVWASVITPVILPVVAAQDTAAKQHSSTAAASFTCRFI